MIKTLAHFTYDDAGRLAADLNKVIDAVNMLIDAHNKQEKAARQ